YSRGFMMDGGTLFEELGFYYVGPIDGHNLDHLLPVLKNVRDMETGPILVHVVTQKGKGYPPAEASADKYHAVVKFDVATGAQSKSKPNAPSYQNVFGQSLVNEAAKDEKIIGITAAMPSVRPTRARSTTPLSAAYPASSSWRPPTRRNWCTWWRPRSPSTTTRARCAIRAAKAAASTCRRSAFRWKSARAASFARAAR